MLAKRWNARIRHQFNSAPLGPTIFTSVASAKSSLDRNLEIERDVSVHSQASFYHAWRKNSFKQLQGAEILEHKGSVFQSSFTKLYFLFNRSNRQIFSFLLTEGLLKISSCGYLVRREKLLSNIVSYACHVRSVLHPKEIQFSFFTEYALQ